MTLKDQLEIIKKSVHSGEDVAHSMDKLQVVVEAIYDDPTERDLMLNMVIDAKHNLLAGYPISTFDDAYSMIVLGLGFSGKQ